MAIDRTLGFACSDALRERLHSFSRNTNTSIATVLREGAAMYMDGHTPKPAFPTPMEFAIRLTHVLAHMPLSQLSPEAVRFVVSGDGASTRALPPPRV